MMKENWKEIVEVLQKAIKNNVKEETYKEKIIYCLRILGWKSNNIELELSLPIGNNNSIRPDIVLCLNNIPFIPIEIKRPANVCNERQEQLISYMRQLKSNIGLYIGNDIRLFYDDPNDINTSICVLKIKLEDNDDKGVILCNLLCFDSFDKIKIDNYCKEKYNEITNHKRIKEYFELFFSEDKLDDNIKELIKDKFIDDGLDQKIVETELNKITFQIRYNHQTPITPIDNYPISNTIKSTSNIKNEDNVKCKEEFSIDGNNYYGVGPFVKMVVEKYVSDHPDITFEELENAFPPKLGKVKNSKSSGVVKTLNKINEIAINFPDIKKRFNIKNPIKLKDGTEVAVNTQWGNNGPDKIIFQSFLNHIKKWYIIHVKDVSKNKYNLNI